MKVNVPSIWADEIACLLDDWDLSSAGEVRVAAVNVELAQRPVGVLQVPMHAPNGRSITKRNGAISYATVTSMRPSCCSSSARAASCASSSATSSSTRFKRCSQSSLLALSRCRCRRVNAKLPLASNVFVVYPDEQGYWYRAMQALTSVAVITQNGPAILPRINCSSGPHGCCSWDVVVTAWPWRENRRVARPVRPPLQPRRLSNSAERQF